jgi:hypothetical protein
MVEFTRLARLAGSSAIVRTRGVFASDESAYATGGLFTVDGGLTAL